MTRTISPLFLLRMSPPPPYKKNYIPALSGCCARRHSLFYSFSSRLTNWSYWNNSIRLPQLLHKLAGKGDQYVAGCVERHLTRYHTRPHPWNVCNCRTNTSPFRSRRHWKNQCTQSRSHCWTLAASSNWKSPQLLSVTFRPGFDGGGVVGAKVDGFTQMNGARNAMKALNKYGFWQTKWKNLGEKKKARAAQQLQRARGVCVKKESRLKWRFSLAV